MLAASANGFSMPKYSDHWWSKLVQTPLSDLLCGRISGRLDVRRQIAATGLPAELCGLTYAVVHGTRLPVDEQIAAAGDLAASFADSLSSGTSVEQVIRDFGNVAEAARSLRRARQRRRHWSCRLRRGLTLASSGALVLLLTVYAFLLGRYFFRQPTIARDYLAEMNAASQSVPTSDRAWPIYRRAILELNPRPLELSSMRQVAPQQWPRLVEYLKRHQAALEMVRQASQRPRLGFFYDDPSNRAWLEQVQDDDTPIRDHREGLYALNSTQVQYLGLLARLLLFDARHAASQQDAQIFESDIRAALAIAGHLRDMLPTLTSELYSLGIYEWSLEELGTTLYHQPELLSQDQFSRLTEAIGNYAGGGSLHVRYFGERLAFHDFIQRIYTDNGEGEGHLTATSIATAQRLSRGSFISLIGDQRLWPSGFSELVRDTSLVTLTADRSELAQTADRLWTQAEMEQQQPLWKWQASAAQAEAERLAESSMTERIHYWPLLLFFPPVETINLRGEFAAQKRDAALTAVALACHYKQHGCWPERLEQLAGDLLPSLPVDRFTGQTLSYRLVDGKPLLYSVALDGNDDQGRPHRMGNEYGQRWEPRSKVLAPHVPARGVPGRQRALGPKFDWDWVLWPPI